MDLENLVLLESMMAHIMKIFFYQVSNDKIDECNGGIYNGKLCIFYQ